MHSHVSLILTLSALPGSNDALERISTFLVWTRAIQANNLTFFVGVALVEHSN